MFGSGSASSSGGRPDLHDPARRRVAFIGFNANTTIRDRFAAMDAFMQQHFANIKPIASNLFPDKDGNPTVHGFVEVCSPKQARMISDTVKSRGLLVPQNAGVRIKPARTEIDTNRVWALREAEGIIKRSPKSFGKSVTVQRSEGRGVYVDGVVAFEQPGRYSRDGVFRGEFSELKLR